MKKGTFSKELVIVIAIMGLGTLARSTLQPILPLYLTSIGIAPEILGLMFSVAMIGMVIGEGSWGWVADKVGLRIPLSAGPFVSGLVVLTLVLTQNIYTIFTIFLFWGIFRSAIYGPGRGYVGANAPPLKKATFMAILAVIMSASRSIGALISGFIVDTWGYHRTFFISSGTAILGSLIAVIGLRKTRLVKSEPPAISLSPNDELSPPDQAFSYRSVTPLFVPTFLRSWGLGISRTFLPLLATQIVGVTATEVGILFTIGALVAMIFFIPMGILADRKGGKTLMILGLLVIGVAMAGTAFAGSYLWLIIFFIIHNLGMAIFGPAAVTLLSDSVPRQRQSTIIGFYGAFAEDTGSITGSALGGVIWSVWGPRVTFLTGAIAAVLGVAVCFGWIREKAYKNHLLKY